MIVMASELTRQIDHIAAAVIIVVILVCLTIARKDLYSIWKENNEPTRKSSESQDHTGTDL